MKKTFFLILLFVASIFTSRAQFYKTYLPSSEFSDSLSKIVKDFKNNFNLIQGKEMIPQPEMNTYQSKTTLPDALHCSIFRYHSIRDTSASWQAIFYDGENYKDAYRIYKDIFNQLKKCKIKIDDKNDNAFIGDFGKPKESVRFTSSSLKLNSNDIIYRNFFADLELTNTYDGWEVQLNLIYKNMN
jgi:hypothetical protein